MIMTVCRDCGCDVPRSRVLVNCSPGQLDSYLGIIMLGLAEHIDLNEKWKHLRFYIGCLVGNTRSDVLYFNLGVYYGNSLNTVMSIRPHDKIEITYDGFCKKDGTPIVCIFDLSEPDSLESIFSCADDAIGQSLSHQKSTGWVELE